uniref:Photolyase/cryptochrome alpha/beta domain-containing protein n=1 Tax=viral metagenome TaxID=1070528 RepID=A0A6C0BRE5_9ZZZZ
MTVLFIFRRDLRIEDNSALNKAIEFAKNNNYKLILAFCFNKKQIKGNPYFSNNSFQFMLESLEELNNKIFGKLSMFDEEDFYEKIKDIKAIAYNIDYTPFSINRDSKIQKFCEKNNISVIEDEDYTLHKIRNKNENMTEPSIKTGSNKAYKKFTPFYEKGLSLTVSEPYTVKLGVKDIINIKTQITLTQYKSDSLKTIKGNRKNGQIIMDQIKDGIYEDYKRNRNIVNHSHSTTKLSAYLKFGCISIRECYKVIKDKYGIRADLIRQLYWREFYANIAYYYPYVLEGMCSNSKTNKSFNNKYDEIKWNVDTINFMKWCKGETGVPLVDAGMRQLNSSGFMHNRLRMITASFLIKDLAIDWRRGERYFATKLVDYDPASNNGGWQWVAGTGTDANPYFRIFNPWNQMKKYDEDCEYIKLWIPELNAIDTKHIQQWYKESVRNMYSSIQYMSPIIDHYTPTGSIQKTKMNEIKERYL